MKAAYRGIADAMIRLVEKEQLKDRKLWELTVEQFAGTPDDADHGWRGEYWGKLMRGACMTWQYTGDEELYEILEDATFRLILTQDEQGRISTYSLKEEFQGWDIWCRKYVLVGLLCFYDICRNKNFKTKILEAAGRHLDYIISNIGKEPRKKSITLASDTWRGINSSSILGPVVHLYLKKKEKRYLEFADYIVESGGAQGFDIFQAAWEDQLYPYQYPVVKAYELMSCFEGLMLYAQVKQSRKWEEAVIRFADKLLESEATIIGGSGCEHELFNHSSMMQTGTKYNGLMLETCVTVTWMKLMYRIYCKTGQIRYLEEVERSAFNALYGAVNTQNSICGPETVFDEAYYRDVYHYAVSHKGRKGQMFDSYSPLRSGIRGRAIGGFKSMENGKEYCGCCIVMGAAGCALVLAAAAREVRRGIEIGIYLPGRIGISVENIQAELLIETRYPLDGEVLITLELQREEEFEIALRIPSFAYQAEFSVNDGEKRKAETGSFLRLFRKWHNGDRIRLSMNWQPRLVRGIENPDDPDSRHNVAIIYGPLTLARDKRLGIEGTEVSIGSGEIEIKREVETKIECQCCFEVKLGKEIFYMIDYASAGKNWRRDSQMGVWMNERAES